MILYTQGLIKILQKTIGGVQAIQKSNIYTSNILILKNGKYYLALKNKYFPPISLDWTVYSFLSIYASIIMTTGKIIRDQIDVPIYKNFPFYGNYQLEQYYRKSHQAPQKLVILSKNFPDQSIQNLVDLKYYTPLTIKNPDINSKFQCLQKKQNINGYLNSLKKFGPTLFDAGFQTLNNYLKNQENLIDMVIITTFEGQLPQSVIGVQYTINFEDYYKVEFVSQKFDVGFGTIYFTVYRK